jgi:hypothetical protein
VLQVPFYYDTLEIDWLTRKEYNHLCSRVLEDRVRDVQCRRIIESVS